MAKELKRILYVEDEDSIRTIAITVLEAVGGFTVIACGSGQQAVEAAPGAAAARRKVNAAEYVMGSRRE